MLIPDLESQRWNTGILDAASYVGMWWQMDAIDSDGNEYMLCWFEENIEEDEMAWSMRTFTNRTFFNALIPFRTICIKTGSAVSLYGRACFAFLLTPTIATCFFTICLTGILSFTIFTAILK